MDLLKELSSNFLWGFLVVLLVCWLTSTILSVLFPRTWRSFLSKTSMAVRLGIILLFLSLSVATSSAVHYWLDYGTMRTVLKAAQIIPFPGKYKPLNPPLELNLCEGEWYPMCAYDEE